MLNGDEIFNGLSTGNHASSSLVSIFSVEDGNDECVCDGFHGDLRKRQFSSNEILHLKEPLVGSF